MKLKASLLWFHHQLTIPISEMWQLLCAKRRGHYPYYGINDHWPMLEVFRRKVRRMAKRHVSRRSQNSAVNWEAFTRFTDLHPLMGSKSLTDLIALDRKRRSTKGK
jgi:RNA-directed DNA polymerase